MLVTWDEPKRIANLEKHGFDFRHLTVAFFLSATIIPARNGRSKAVNELAGRVMTAIFAPLGTEAFTIIRLRPASLNERRQRA